MSRPSHTRGHRNRSAAARLSWRLTCLILLFSACGTFEVGLVPTPTATPSLLRYENDAYGFAFTYPSAWTVGETPHTTLLQKGSLTLRISYKRVDEAEEIGADLGIPTQGTVYIQKLTFLGQTMPAIATIYDRKIKAVNYDAPRPVTRADLVFAITLTDAASNASGDTYAAVDIPDTVLEETKDILESLERLPSEAPSTAKEQTAEDRPADPTYLAPTPRPGWARYINAAYGFAFEYPTSWELRQRNGGTSTSHGPLPDAIELTQGDTCLTIEVQRKGETPAVGSPDTEAGQLSVSGVVPFMGRSMAKRTLRFGETDKRVSCHCVSGDLEFNIMLAQASGSSVPFEDFALTEAVQADMDDMLRTFAPYP